MSDTAESAPLSATNEHDEEEYVICCDVSNKL